MIPTQEEVKKLWDTYHLPSQKQLHSQLVCDLAKYFAEELEKKGIQIRIDLLLSAALIHDIDKNLPQKVGEQHPLAGVRLLYKLGMPEMAHIVSTHPLHAILDEKICPKTWEEKILFLSDKMVKYDIISVDERFQLWREEPLSEKERFVLEEAYPQVKQLEEEILSLLGKTSNEVIDFCKSSILSKGGSPV
jgi:HD superfamily phosphodiesterase